MNLIKTFAIGGYRSTTAGNSNAIFPYDDIACKGLAAMHHKVSIRTTAGGFLLRKNYSLETKSKVLLASLVAHYLRSQTKSLAKLQVILSKIYCIN